MLAVLHDLRTHHHDAEVSCITPCPDRAAALYGIPGVPLSLARDRREARPSPVSRALRKALDPLHVLRVVRRFDVVIVPGMGVLEESLPVRVRQVPYALLLLTIAGRLTGTRVALVSVGAEYTRRRLLRWTLAAAARLAHYLSFRDEASRAAVRAMGAGRGGAVYPDLAFGLPTTTEPRTSAVTVGVGVIDYRGRHTDRVHAEEIWTSYVDELSRLVVGLLDDGRRVRLLTGDPTDSAVVRALVTHVERHRGPDARGRLVAEPADTFADVVRAVSDTDVVVASRFHNLLCALKLGRPAISLGYAAKSDHLMEEMGLAEFCHPIRGFDAERVAEQVGELLRRRDEIGRELRDRAERNEQMVDRQFADLERAVLDPLIDGSRATPDSVSPTPLEGDHV
jgi:polysaccharide pyruvyl transferase WcaK-like protein